LLAVLLISFVSFVINLVIYAPTQMKYEDKSYEDTIPKLRLKMQNYRVPEQSKPI